MKSATQPLNNNLNINVPSAQPAPSAKPVLSTESEEVLYGIQADGTRIEFLETDTLGDGNCGFYALGVTRQQLTDELRKFASNENIRREIAEEILEAFRVKLLITPEATDLFEKEEKQEEKYRQLVSQCKEELGTEWRDIPNEDQADMEHRLVGLLKTSNVELKEKLLKTRLEVFRIAEDISQYCQNPIVFILYLDKLNLEKPALHLGTKSAKAYARIKNINLNIWYRIKPDEDKIAIKDFHTVKDPINTINMLHTGRSTHFNLLVKKDSPEVRKTQDQQLKSQNNSKEVKNDKNPTTWDPALINKAKEWKKLYFHHAEEAISLAAKEEKYFEWLKILLGPNLYHLSVQRAQGTNLYPIEENKMAHRTGFYNALRTIIEYKARAYYDGIVLQKYKDLNDKEEQETLKKFQKNEGKLSLRLDDLLEESKSFPVTIEFGKLESIRNAIDDPAASPEKKRALVEELYQQAKDRMAKGKIFRGNILNNIDATENEIIKLNTDYTESVSPKSKNMHIWCEVEEIYKNTISRIEGLIKEKNIFDGILLEKYDQMFSSAVSTTVSSINVNVSDDEDDSKPDNEDNIKNQVKSIVQGYEKKLNLNQEVVIISSEFFDELVKYLNEEFSKHMKSFAADEARDYFKGHFSSFLNNKTIITEISKKFTEALEENIEYFFKKSSAWRNFHHSKNITEFAKKLTALHEECKLKLENIQQKRRDGHTEEAFDEKIKQELARYKKAGIDWLIANQNCLPSSFQGEDPTRLCEQIINTDIGEIPLSILEEESNKTLVYKAASLYNETESEAESVRLGKILELLLQHGEGIDPAPLSLIYNKKSSSPSQWNILSSLLNVLVLNTPFAQRIHQDLTLYTKENAQLLSDDSSFLQMIKWFFINKEVKYSRIMSVMDYVFILAAGMNKVIIDQYLIEKTYAILNNYQWKKGIKSEFLKMAGRWDSYGKNELFIFSGNVPISIPTVDIVAENRRLQNRLQDFEQKQEKIVAELAQNKAVSEKMVNELMESKAQTEQFKKELIESRAENEKIKKDLAEKTVREAKVDKELQENRDQIQRLNEMFNQFSLNAAGSQSETASPKTTGSTHSLNLFKKK